MRRDDRAVYVSLGASAVAWALWCLVMWENITS